ncbi:hypothetical protein [Actinotignum urinale]|uniref:hypothetical protein n=1 Tax=Actinotignum urinale TaxID=190146 RepID=UPI00370D6BFE
MNKLQLSKHASVRYRTAQWRLAFRVAMGIIIGMFTALLGTLAHAGMVGFPVLGTDVWYAGLILAGVLVATGALYVWDACGVEGWFAFYLTSFALTIILVYFPWNENILVVKPWLAHVWLILNSVCGLWPGIRRKSK